MDTNDLNRRLRFALTMDDSDVIDSYRHVGYEASIELVKAWRIKLGEPDYVPCPPAAIHAMLNGVVIQRRGPQEPLAASSTPSTEKKADATSKTQSGNTSGSGDESVQIVDNNEILKQIRIALSLRTDDVLTLINSSGGKLSKGELNALFRNRSARNYRRCGDQVLRWFLSALASARDVKPSDTASGPG